ncbi:hypothetical protein [Dyella subtropica]|uniref:hypothetical protein n=1 Tax=Dyella subtropica TaxID=2992127 RepID=UPI00224F40E0|nr:hypothetical protein [Dyella subtropica]
MDIAVSRLHTRILAIGGMLLSLALPSSSSMATSATQANASSAQPPSHDLFRELQPLKNDLQRYRYLSDALPRLPLEERIALQQLLAAVEDELGLYDEAVRDFPFDNRIQFNAELPQPAEWQASDAVEVITKLAADRRIVMVNEAHHDAHTRALTLALLPRLRAEGFTHFAAEALNDHDGTLMQRGYPVADSGSEYLHEPLYGEIVRQAIQLGFIVVPYESEAGDLAEREAGQARQLYRKVFQAEPNARLFVHAGYAHIDKAPGNLGGTIPPMAMLLKRLSGFDPLTIDQTRWRDIGSSAGNDSYRQLLTLYQPQGPVVLTRRADGTAWSSDPTRHDVDVLLPPTGHQRRPHWLSLDGRRKSHLITTELCNSHLPCVIEARYAHESSDAIPADRYGFLDGESMNSLYLYPGSYRLRAWDVDGRTLTQRNIDVPRP